MAKGVGSRGFWPGRGRSFAVRRLVAVHLDGAGLHASLPRMRHIVPQADDRFLTAVVFKGENADAGGTAEEQPTRARRQAEPAGRDHADDVAAGKPQHVAIDVVDAGEKAVGTGGDVFGRFALGAAIMVEFPAGPGAVRVFSA